MSRLFRPTSPSRPSRPSTSAVRRLLPPLVVAALAASLLAPAAGSAARPKKRPDLVVAGVAATPAVVAPGGAVTLTHQVRNRGPRSASASQTRFYLSADAAAGPGDIRLGGDAAVAKVRPRASVTPRPVRAVVPSATRPGAYWVLACADALRRVREKNERNNCTVAARRLTVRAPQPPPPDEEDLDLQQYADAFRWPDDERQTLQQVQVFCQAVQPARTLTLTQAVASARASLAQRADAGALALLDSSGQASTAAKAQDLAAVAISQGSPGLALAALLKAHDLAPGSAAHLLNAAAVAATVGLPNEALSLLDAAAGLPLKQAPMGVDQRTTADVVRANALVLTGRATQARPLYLAARRAEPLLSEADTGLATIEACAGEDAKAMRWLRRSRQRSQEPQDLERDPVRPAPALDASRGRATGLRPLPTADSPAQLVRLKPLYDEIADGFVAEIDAHNAEDDELSARIRVADQSRTRAEVQRRSGILVTGYRVTSEPDIAALEDTYHARILDVTEVVEDFFGEGTGEGTWTYSELIDQAVEACAGPDPYPPCFDLEMNRICRPAMVSAHQDFLARLSEARAAGEALQRAYSLRLSGYAANLADPDAYRLAMLGVSRGERGVYGGLSAAARSWATHVDRVRGHCVEMRDGPVPPVPGVPVPEGNGACSGALQAMSFSLAAGPTKLKVSCEKISQTISSGVGPLLGAFASVEYDFRAGKVTVFAGSQLDIGVGAKLGLKSGVYLTADKTGLTDAGWRVSKSTSVGAGPVEVKMSSEDLDISVLSALRGTP